MWNIVDMQGKVTEGKEKNSLRTFADRLRQMYQRGRSEYKMFKISSVATKRSSLSGIPERSAVKKTDNLVLYEIANNNNALTVIRPCCQ
jgi:hypothetical protein